MLHRSTAGWLALIALAAPLSGCVTGRTELLSRELIQDETRDVNCKTVIFAELSPDWPITSLYPYTAQRCDAVSTRLYAVHTREQLSDLTTALGSIIGSVGVTGGAYLLYTSIQTPPSGPGPHYADAAATMVGTAVALGTSFVGAAAGFGMVKLIQKVRTKHSTEVDPEELVVVDRERRGLDGTLEADPQHRWTAHQGRLDLDASAVLAMNPQTLKLDGAPLQLDPAQLQQLKIAQACARSLEAAPHLLAQLEDLTLQALTTDARTCFEGGVTAADGPYSALLKEQMGRRLVH